MYLQLTILDIVTHTERRTRSISHTRHKTRRAGDILDWCTQCLLRPLSGGGVKWYILWLLVILTISIAGHGGLRSVKGFVIGELHNVIHSHPATRLISVAQMGRGASDALRAGSFLLG